jgi:site-specific DNA-methyltransferase (adenine-specific)
MIRVINADMRDALRDLSAQGVQFHSCVTDPPYELNFMGRKWDNTGVAFQPETWRAVYDVLLPGAHLLAFGGTRTFHRLVCAIEDAGFEIRDSVAFMYGSGFPKSLDVSKAIDKAAGVSFTAEPASGVGFMGPNGPGGYNPTINRLRRTGETTPEAAQWAGWGTALKPAFEPIVVARKPLIGTVAANVLAHGCGAMNIDACRVPAEARPLLGHTGRSGNVFGAGLEGSRAIGTTTEGRWPANVIHDGSAEVEEAFAAFGESRARGNIGASKGGGGMFGHASCANEFGSGDSGSASRFFFSAKADKADRAGSLHPTIKPTSLMRWLVQLVTPPGGTVLDPFAGSGSTGLAADQLGMNAVLIERDPEYAADIERKITGDAPLFADVAVAKAPAPKEAGPEQPGMFGDAV